MFCAKCGTEVSEGSKFCAKCGAPVSGVVAVETNAGKMQDVSVPAEEAQPAASEVQPAAEEGKKSGKLPIVPFAAGAAVLLLAAAVGVGSFFLFRGKDDPGSADRTGGGNTENDGETIADWRELEPLYTIEDVPIITIYEHNYVAGTKAPGIAWDSTLFYWLEDIDQTSSEDGYLARCTITKMVLRSAYSGQLIQYEIYRDPQTDEIYKIVSIEHEADSIRLVDYYYQSGVPNFTFSRNDSVYTPTYATPAKTGERYYFNSDVMARWRMIQEPNVIKEYVLTPNGASYTQTDYFAEGADFQAVYDDIELREINAARNTYDAVAAAGNGIGLVEGRVTDTAGNPVAGVTVDILRGEDGVLLYRGITGEDGSFTIFVYLEDVECSIIVRGNDTFDSNSIQGVMLARATGGSSFGNLLMHRLDGDEYPVHINVYAAADVRTGEDGSLLRDLLPGARVSLRAGAGARTGEVLQALEADGDGRVNTTLPAGTYTAQIDVAGYASAYVTVEVAEKETTAEGYVLPMPEADRTGIVLTWEGEADLDLTMFTPYQSTNGDMAHIGGRITDDGYGNRLVADNASGCEVMYVNTAVLGNYKLYVNNYTESEAGNYSSAQLSDLNIHIYIYDSTGLIGEYSFPAGEIGVVWEVADLNGSQVTPSQRVYVSLEGKSWWTENKRVLDLEGYARLCDQMHALERVTPDNQELMLHMLNSFVDIKVLGRPDLDGILVKGYESVIPNTMTQEEQLNFVWQIIWSQFTWSELGYELNAENSYGNLSEYDFYWDSRFEETVLNQFVVEFFDAQINDWNAYGLFKQQENYIYWTAADGAPWIGGDKCDVWENDSYYMISMPCFYGSNAGEENLFQYYVDALFRKNPDSRFGVTLCYVRAYTDEIQISRVDVSSTLPDNQNKSYGADKLIDGDITTPWVEGSVGDGTGETITIHLSEPTTVYGILMYNGYLESEYLYQANGKPKTVQVDFGNGNIVTHTIGWTNYEMTKTWPERIQLPQSVVTDTITITILEAASGSVYTDMCIGEIIVF
ncbi:MAG: zinc-ribbon domain-containing protein [Lachnospiraceae bacterium]|nr:zinc-ribbon domain-containing protein [Lachnospiraceae bacterium]